MTKYKLTFIVKRGILRKSELNYTETVKKKTLTDLLLYIDEVEKVNSKFLKRKVENIKIELLENE